MRPPTIAMPLLLLFACGGPPEPVDVDLAGPLAERAEWLLELHSHASTRIAMSLLEEAEAHDPGHPAVLALKAELEARGGRGNSSDGSDVVLRDQGVLRELEAGLRRSPEDVELTLAVARMHLVLQQPTRSIELLEGLLASQPKHPEALLRRGEALVALERPQESELALQAAIDAALEQGDTLTVFQAQGALGEAWIMQGRDDHVLEVLNESSRQLTAYRAAHPGTTTVNCPHETLAKLHTMQGDYAKAAEHAREAADLRAWMPRLQYLAALASLRAGEHELAQVYHQRGTVKDRAKVPSPLRVEVATRLREDADATPRSAQAAVELASTLLALDRPDLVTDTLAPFLEDDGCSDCLLLAGYAAVEGEGIAEAPALFGRATQGPGAEVGQAWLALTEGRSDEARTLLTPLCSPAADDEGPMAMAVSRMACNGLGASATNLGDDAAAEAAYSMVLARYPDDLQALRGRGNALNGLGQSTAALEHFQRVLMIAPDDPKALTGVGTALLNSGEHTLAADVFRAALEVAPEGWSCPHEGLGLVLLAQGNTSAARERLERAVAVDPDSDHRKYDALARMALEAGDHERARTLLERSLANNPAGVEAQTMLDQLPPVE